MPIAPNNSYNLMAIPEVSEAIIKHSLLKGELKQALSSAKIQITLTDIDLTTFNIDALTDFTNYGLSNSIYDGTISVFSLNNLPPPVDGYITLSNKIYIFYGTVDIGLNTYY